MLAGPQPTGWTHFKASLERVDVGSRRRSYAPGKLPSRPIIMVTSSMSLIRNSAMMTLTALLAVSHAQTADAQVVGGPNTVRYRAGVISSICSISAVDGELGAATDRATIASNRQDLPGGFFGNPQSAAITVDSNMTQSATLIAQTPTLVGTTAPANSELRFANQLYGPTSVQNLNPDGSLNTTLDVKFGAPAGGFANGLYTATAIVTCNQ